MAGKTGNQKIIEQFLADGMDHMFGNPGTVEQGFLDAVGDYPDMKYILTLQESIAVLMGDAYARASQKPTLVQLHSSPGIGNAVGALYQAKRGHSPLVVIGADAGTQYMNMDAQMANDLVAMMAPVTKYSTMVLSSKSLLRTLRRAIKIAGTAPMGPVYVCLPMNILDEINDEEVFPSSIPSTRVAPDVAIIKQVAQKLIAAEKPVLFIGDGIAYSGATEELTKLAELLGAEVYGVEYGDFIMDYCHPLYQGSTGHMFGSYSLPIAQKADVNLIIGTYMLPEVFPELGDIFGKGSSVIHFDLNAYEIGKNHRVDIGVVSDPKLSIEALIAELETLATAEWKAKVTTRTAAITAAKEAKYQAEVALDKNNNDGEPLHMFQFAIELAKRIDTDNTVIFDEALTSSPAITRYIPPSKPGNYFVTRGGSLGIGFPGAIGVKFFYPQKTVIGFSGDGGSMYTIQALWSAARHNTAAKFVVCNNGTYKLLQLNIDNYWKENKSAVRPYPISFDLSYPAIRFDLLAKSLGVDAVRVEDEAGIIPAIEKMLATDGPFLIDLVIQGNHNAEIVQLKCASSA